MESSESLKKKFIRTHEAEIGPLVRKEELKIALKEIAAEQPVPEEAVDALIERYETRVFVSPELHDAPQAKRILLEASQTQSFNTIFPIVKALETDERCKDMTVIADSVAGISTEEKLPEFQQLHGGTHRPVIADIPGPYDIALATQEPANAPESLMLSAAKSVFGAKKLYYLAGAGYFTPGRRLDKEHAATVDGFLVADELTKELIMRKLGVPEERIFMTGSAIIDTLEVEKAAEYRQAAREQLGISSETTTLLYLGFPSIDTIEIGGDPEVNRKTFATTVEAAIRAAENNPDRKFAVVLRLHPRGTETYEDTLQKLPSFPENLSVISGKEIKNISQLIYGADVLGCLIGSSESFLAKYRGVKAAVFSYPGTGLTGELLQHFDKDAREAAQTVGGVRFVDSTDALAEVLREADPKKWSAPAASDTGNSTQRILDVILSEEPVN